MHTVFKSKLSAAIEAASGGSSTEERFTADVRSTGLPLWPNRRLLAKQVLGVSERSSHDITSQDWFPDPIELGPRILRWNLYEVLEALASRAPRRATREEPARLAQAREQRGARSATTTATAAA